MWKIINTTDGKYLGAVVAEPFIGDMIEFFDGFKFQITAKRALSNKMILENSNYIITLTMER